MAPYPSLYSVFDALTVAITLCIMFQDWKLCLTCILSEGWSLSQLILKPFQEERNSEWRLEVTEAGEEAVATRSTKDGQSCSDTWEDAARNITDNDTSNWNFYHSELWNKLPLEQCTKFMVFCFRILGKPQHLMMVQPVARSQEWRVQPEPHLGAFIRRLFSTLTKTGLLPSSLVDY